MHGGSRCLHFKPCLFIHRQTPVTKERLEIKNDFIRSGYIQVRFSS